MSRYRGVLVSSLGLVLGWAGSALAAPGPNVLFIAIDDLRTDLGCYGHPVVKTPHMDRLSRRGMRFDRAYVQVSFCNPSRSSFLTGLRPDATRVLNNEDHFRKNIPDVVTLPQLFREAGYHTSRLGKIYHGAGDMEDPKSWDAVEYPKGTPLGKEKHEGRNLTGGKLKWCTWASAKGGDEDQPDGEIAAKAVAFLAGRHDKPFFLAAGFHKPHDPFVAPKAYFDMYPPESLRLHRDPPGASPTPERQVGGATKKVFDAFTDRERLEFQRAYHACTTFVDAQIGKVLDAVEKNGLGGNTLIFLLSDHGYHLGERGWWNKTTLYEYSCRSPLMVYAPGMKAKGTPCSRLVEFVDVYPTVAGLAGLKAPAGLHGRSFAPLLDDPAQPWKEAAFSQVRRGQVMGRTVRTERWRYVEWEDGADPELFDHDADAGEWKNLAAEPAQATTIARLSALLRASVIR
ncbi:MAG: sulfatase [Verrucomicrobiae bacterium]|nr:sulfatase [Verrucomicrobiae bacterium]